MHATMRLGVAGVCGLALACSNGPSTDDTDTDVADTDVVDTDVEVVTFADVEGIFERSCTTYGCHGGPELSTGLDLSAGQAYGMLVNVPSTQLPTYDRVEPGDPVNSYLIAKLRPFETFSEIGVAGDRMPSIFGLSQSEINKITAWVEAGALP